MAFILSEKTKLIYINMPKSGCTTIKNYLHFFQNEEWYKEPLDIHFINAELLPNLGYKDSKKIYADNYFVFTFVRHPHKRAYSCYLEKVLHDSKYSFPRVKTLLEKRYNCDFSKYTVETEKDNFYKFLLFVKDTLNKKIDFRADYHWAPQSHILRKACKIIYPSFIGKIEDFKRDFDYVLAKNDIVHKNFTYKRLNQNPLKDSTFKYDEIVDERIMELLFSIYKSDLRNFNYLDEQTQTFNMQSMATASKVLQSASK